MVGSMLADGVINVKPLAKQRVCVWMEERVFAEQLVGWLARAIRRCRHPSELRSGGGT